MPAFMPRTKLLLVAGALGLLMLLGGLIASQADARPDSRKVVSTAYCLRGTMADGTYTRRRSVASNQFPLGTRLYVKPSPTGMRHFVVRDRIGHGTELDFWTPTCAQAIRWGRRTVLVRRR